MPLGKYKPQVPLSSESHVMQWNPQLNIYRVNRYNELLKNSRKNLDIRYGVDRIDFIEELLHRNLDHCVFIIFSHFSFKELVDLQLVCPTWNSVIGSFVLKRRIEILCTKDQNLMDLIDLEGWSDSLFRPVSMVEDPMVYKKICAKLLLLKDMWQSREPKVKRLFCDSFVLSIRSDDSVIFCGLNNGCVQAWDVSYLGKIREQECHDKGVKCLDFNDDVLITGSYDTTLKVWRRDNWVCVKTLSLHKDSIWDLRLHNDKVVTGGLDGAIIVFRFISTYDLEFQHYIQQEGDLVSAVDFSASLLVAGFENGLISVWRLETGQRKLVLSGHNGGVTGINVQVHIAASCSYDTEVRIWNINSGSCIKVLKDHDNFARCISFSGNRIVSGDFGGNILLWDLTFHEDDNGEITAKIVNKRHWQSHTGHVVCIHLNPRRIISGSRDRTVAINDFWLKTLDTLTQRQKEDGRKFSRFLRRYI